MRASCLKATTRRGATRRAKDFVDHHYHNFSDNYDADWDFRGQCQAGALWHGAGLAGDSAPQMVEWKAGDEFEAARKRSEAK